MKIGRQAYNTDAQAIADWERKNAEKAHSDFMHGQAQIAAHMGISLSEWQLERTTRLKELTDFRETRWKALYGDPPCGPMLNRREPWAAEYAKFCVDTLVSIYDHQIKPPALASLVLEAFRERLSDSAVARWEGIATK